MNIQVMIAKRHCSIVNDFSNDQQNKRSFLASQPRKHFSTYCSQTEKSSNAKYLQRYMAMKLYPKNGRTK